MLWFGFGLGPGRGDHLCAVGPGTSIHSWQQGSCTDPKAPLTAPSCLCSFQLAANSELFVSFSGGKKIVFFKWLCGKHSFFPLLLGLCLFSQQCLMLRRRGMVISQPCELGLGRGVTQPAPGHSCCPQPHLVTLWHFSVLYCCSQ